MFAEQSSRSALNDTARVAVGILGPIELVGPLGGARLAGPQQQALLGLLALNPGRMVGVSRLVDAIWGDEPPRTAVRTLQSIVSRVRRALEACGLPGVLVTQKHGYTLLVSPDSVDSHRFRSAVDQARQLQAESRMEAAIDMLRFALGCWRGAPLDGCDLAGWASAEVAGLVQLRLGALERLWELELKRGRCDDAIAGLELLVVEYPLRERLWELLMWALNAVGRRGEALMAYQRARRILVDELGVEPGPQLRLYHTELLQDAEATVVASLQPQHTAMEGLPVPLTSMVGRDGAVSEVVSLLSSQRMVTLTGTGGVGKTRLAIAVTASAAAELASEAAFVELSAVTERVPDALAKACGIREQAGVDPMSSVIGALRRRSLVLVLDACEHLTAACRETVAALLAECPQIKVLATSRQPLRLSGETVWPVAPLPVPEAGADLSLAALEQFAGVRLFLDRSRERSGRGIDECEAAAVAQLCAALDGLPLALELAAARTVVLSVPEIVDRLDDRFRLLVNIDPVGAPRHVGLREVLDWSYNLASPMAQEMLRSLAVCAGGFTLSAAEKLGNGGDELSTVDVLGELLDKSLIGVNVIAGRSRYRMLESIHEYASARLKEHPAQRIAVQQVHADYFLELAEQAADHLRGTEQQAWLARLAAEHENLRIAMDFLAQQANSADDLRLATALAWYCYQRGHYREGRHWLQGALHRRPEAPSALRVLALTGATSLAFLQADYHIAADCARDAISLCERSSQPVPARLWCQLGDISRDLADYEQAIARYRTGAEGYRATGDAWGQARALLALGLTGWLSGDLDGAERNLAESHRMFDHIGDSESLASVTVHLGAVAFYRGDQSAARGLLRAAHDRFADLDFKEGLAWEASLLGLVELRDGDCDAACAALCSGLGVLDGLGDAWRAASVCEALAAVAAARAEPATSARLIGAATALRERTGAPVPTVERPLLTWTQSVCRAALGDTAFADLLDEGRKIELQQFYNTTPIPMDNATA